MQEQQRQSEIILIRIKETEQETAALDSKLSQLEADKKALLGAQELDLQAIEKLENEAGRVAKERQHLELRLPILQGNLAEAERAEAAQRQLEIIVEAEKLAAESEGFSKEWAAAIAPLVGIAKEIFLRVQKRNLLADEMMYLQIKFRLDRVRVPGVPASQPIIDALDHILDQIKQSRLFGLYNPWSNKLADLKNKERAEESKRRSNEPPARVVRNGATSWSNELVDLKNKERAEQDRRRLSESPARVVRDNTVGVIRHDTVGV